MPFNAFNINVALLSSAWHQTVTHVVPVVTLTCAPNQSDNCNLQPSKKTVSDGVLQSSSVGEWKNACTLKLMVCLRLREAPRV